MVKSETIKGFRDIPDASKRSSIKKLIEDVFKLYGFGAVETPIIEYEEFVKSGNSDDEVISDVFKLQDKGKRKLALRYEFTFQLKRLAKNKKLPFRVYQIGPVFRDEPISSNRFRQFVQCDADIVGSNIKDEAEILKIVTEILEKIGIKFEININNRKLLNEILNDIGVKKKQEALREIDKIDKLKENDVRTGLKKIGAEKVLAVLKKPVSVFEKYKAYSEIKELKKQCALRGVKVNFAPYLARGLSYYNGTIFEIKTKDIKESICGGGSYLVNGLQATGISLGLDRLESLAKIKLEDKKVLIISIDQDKKTISIADKLRKQGIACAVSFDKIGKAMEYANSYGLDYAIIIGSQEAKKKKFKLKNMKTGREKLVTEQQLIKEF